LGDLRLNWLCSSKKTLGTSNSQAAAPQLALLVTNFFMASIKQIEANRRNALKSTGPKTASGKAAVRLNPLRHGLRARDVILPDEEPEEFHQLCDDLETEWQPRTRTEQFYLEQMAVSQWKLTRVDWGEADLFGENISLEKSFQILHRLWQTQNRLERSYARAQRELERLQSSRRQDTLLGDASRQEGAAEEASTACGAPYEPSETEPSNAAMPGAEIAPGPQPDQQLPWPPTQTRDLIAQLYASEGDTRSLRGLDASPPPEVARDAGSSGAE
jgi:hypothetical protein